MRSHECEAMNFEAYLVGLSHANPWSMAMAMEVGLVGDSKSFVTHEAMEVDLVGD